MKNEIYIAISLQDYQLKLLTKYKDEHSLTREDAKELGTALILMAEMAAEIEKA